MTCTGHDTNCNCNCDKSCISPLGVTQEEVLAMRSKYKCSMQAAIHSAKLNKLDTLIGNVPDIATRTALRGLRDMWFGG